MDTIQSPTDTPENPSTMFFCRICQSVYRQPKILPCLHSFCRPCLVETVTHGREGTVIECPVCSHKAKLPPSGVVGVPDNTFLNRLAQEYLSEVQSNLVARSMQSGASISGVPTTQYQTATRPKARTSSQGSDSEESRRSRGESPPAVLAIDRGHTGQTTESALEAIRNMSRLQTKIMSLQGEALRITYAIDQVNQCMLDWHQHKDDLKKAIQRRTSQYQFFIKRMEHQLISQIDSKQADDDFYAFSDTSKTELRAILKNILHEVSVLKSVQELGKDAEINALSANLLGKSVSMADVQVEKFHFDIDIPSKSIEEIVEASFGKVKLSSEKNTIYAPEVEDFSDIPVADVTRSPSGEKISHNISEEKEVPIKEDEELEAAVGKAAQRRSSERRSRRHMTDLGLGNEDVKAFLASFQNARENFQARRREILAQGQQAREDMSPLRIDSRRPRSTSRQGRVQSVDRSNLPLADRGRSLLPNKPRLPGSVPATTQSEVSPQTSTEVPSTEASSRFQYTTATGRDVGELIPEDASVPSATTREVSHPPVHRGRLVKQTSDPRYTHEMKELPEDISESEAGQEDTRASLMEQLRGRRFSNPTTTQDPSLVFEQQVPLEVPGQSLNSSRPVRRAFSAAADRKSKMDYLRETWQKRKEILIQNEGFVSPESNLARQAAKISGMKSPPASPSQSPTSTQAPSSAKVLTSSPPLSPDDPSTDRMQQIKSRLAHYKSELTKTDGAADGVIAESNESVIDKTPEDESKSHVPQTATPQQAEVSVSPAVTTLSQEPTKPVEVTSSATAASASSILSRYPRLYTRPTVSQTPAQAITTAETASTTQTTAATPSTTTTTATVVDRYSRLHTKPTDTPSVTASAGESSSDPAATVYSILSKYSRSYTKPVDSTTLTPATTLPQATSSTAQTTTASILSRYYNKPAEVSAATTSKDDAKSETSSTITTTTTTTAAPTSTAATYSRFSWRYARPTETTNATKQPTTTTPLISQPSATTTTTAAATTTTATTTFTRHTRYQFTKPQSDTTSSTSQTTATTSSSRYSKSYTKPSENFDVASLIAAMYSGNEKSIVQRGKAPLAPTSPIITQPQDNNNKENTPTIPSKLERAETLTTPARVSTIPSTTTSSTILKTHQSQTKSVDPIGITPQSPPAPETKPKDMPTPSPTSTPTPKTQTNGTTPIESPKKPESRRNRRDPSRRHTTDIGRETIQAALRTISGSDANTSTSSSSTVTQEIPTIQHGFVSTAYPSRFPSYRTRILGQPSDVEQTHPMTTLPEMDDMQDSTISVNISAQGVVTKTIPSPLNLDPPAESGSTSLFPFPASPPLSRDLTTRATPPSPARSPTSPAANAGPLQGKLREIARKKKERWRHLTIH